MAESASSSLVCDLLRTLTEICPVCSSSRCFVSLLETLLETLLEILPPSLCFDFEALLVSFDSPRYTVFDSPGKASLDSPGRVNLDSPDGSIASSS